MDTSRPAPVVIYTPQSQLRRPRQLWRDMWKDLTKSRELAWRFFVRDLAAQYRQSLLGVFWAFFPPLMTSFIFIALRENNLVNVGETPIPYPVFVLIGTILWQLFSESLHAPLRSVTAARSMLVRINFPREALIVSAMYGVLFNLLIKWVVIAGIFILYHIPFTTGVFLALLVMFSIILLGISLGLLLTPLGMLYNDVASALPIVLQIWFFLTPVVYPVPQAFSSIKALNASTLAGWLVNLNPVTPLLGAARELLTQGALATGTLTTPLSLLWVNVIVLFLLLLGWVIFRISLPIIIERISA